MGQLRFNHIGLWWLVKKPLQSYELLVLLQYCFWKFWKKFYDVTVETYQSTGVANIGMFSCIAIAGYPWDIALRDILSLNRRFMLLRNSNGIVCERLSYLRVKDCLETLPHQRPCKSMGEWQPTLQDRVFWSCIPRVGFCH